MNEPLTAEEVRREIAAINVCHHCDPDGPHDQGRIHALTWVADRLEAARTADRPSLRDVVGWIVDRSPLVTDGETGGQWCFFCGSMRKDHEPSCEWAALRQALEGGAS